MRSEMDALQPGSHLFALIFSLEFSVGDHLFL